MRYRPRHRIWIVLALAVLSGIGRVGTADAAWQRTERSGIARGSYRNASPRIRIRTRLRMDLEGWLVAASDSSLTLYPQEELGRFATKPSRAFREISNASILSIEIDRSAVRDFREKPPEAAKPVGTPAAPTGSAGQSTAHRSGISKGFFYAAGALAVVATFLVLR